MAKAGILEHPKTIALADSLGIMDCFAVGILEVFWHHVAKHFMDGNVTSVKPNLLARSLRYSGDGEQLWRALIDCGFVDDHDGVLLVHDWSEHATDAVHLHLARAHRWFSDGTVPRMARMAVTERERILAWFSEHESARQAHGKRTPCAQEAHLPSHPLPSPPIPSHPLEGGGERGVGENQTPATPPQDPSGGNPGDPPPPPDWLSRRVRECWYGFPMPKGVTEWPDPGKWVTAHCHKLLDVFSGFGDLADDLLRDYLDRMLAAMESHPTKLTETPKTFMERWASNQRRFNNEQLAKSPGDKPEVEYEVVQ